MKNTVIQKVCSTMIAGLLATGFFSNSSAGQTLEDNQAKFHQRCEELKQDDAKIKQAAQSPNISREQKEQATKAAAALEKVITATEGMLKDPALKTSPEKQEAIFAQAQSAIVYGNALASTTEKQLGVPRSGMTDHVIAANVNIDGLLTQVSRFDGSSPPYVTGDEGFKGSGVGNAFFGIGANTSTPVSVNAQYVPTTPQAAKNNVATYESSGGGILLEDAAGGLGRVSAVKYDGRYNALVMDNRLVYFMKVPSWDAAALCRAIARDEKMRVGVSMGSKESLVFGQRSAYENTGVAHNLLLADHFLGDFVFGWHKWTNGYKFPKGYEPQTAEVTADMLVQFVFKGFQFTTTKDNELQPTNLALVVRFMPVSKTAAPNGGMLPDIDVLERGYEPPAGFLANAQYLTSNFDFFRQERIVAKTIAYGELAALFRSYKQSGVNLEALASELQRG